MAFSEQFGVSATGTPLRWNVFMPNEAFFPPPWDVVPAIHGGGWASGHRNQMSSLAGDFANAGLVCLPIDYELSGAHGAPLLDGQADPVIWPNQVPDCRLAVLAARTPDSSSVLFGKVTGKVAVLGGSAGATHAATLALTGTVDADRPDHVCMLSANYDFADEDTLDQYEGQIHWSDDVYAYCDVPDRTHLVELAAKSILPMLVGATNIPALYMVQSQADTVGLPVNQQDVMVTALQGINFTNFIAAVVDGGEHAQGNWHVPNKIDGVLTGNLVLVDVINWFKEQFLIGTGGEPPPPPDHLPKGFRLTLTGGPYTLVGANEFAEYPPEVRSATITNLAPSMVGAPKVYDASLVAFNEFGDSVPATYQFTSPVSDFMKGQPCGIYHLVGGGGGSGDWWTQVPGEVTLGYDWIIGMRGRSGLANIQPDSPVGYDWSGFQGGLDILTAAGKKLGSSIAVGISAPDWWYDIGGPDEVARIAIDLADITPQAYQPVIWDPKHLIKMQTWITAQGAKWDADPSIAYWIVGGFMQGNEGFISKTLVDDAKWDQAALDFDYTTKFEAYMAVVPLILQMYITAFPNTQLYFTSQKPWKGPDGPTTQNAIENYITSSTNIGLMTAFKKAAQAPWDPPVKSPYPKGGQAVGNSNDSRFYLDPVPDPLPPRAQRMTDFVHNNLNGCTFLEIYVVDAEDATCEDALTEGNTLLCANLP